MAFYEVFYWLPGVDYEYFGVLAKQDSALKAEATIKTIYPGHVKYQAVKLEPKTHEEQQAILERYYKRNKPIVYDAK